ncbi:MAG: hypothetical protein E7631_00050 [Ruminococcaceae bacterium]|nr:hypothetical protein [Oscillospiraceae bacterium]
MREIFASLLGNQYIRDTLAPDLIAGKAAHGYILSGPAGSGKKTAARLIAASSVCENRESDRHPLPCGVCPNCHKILQDISTDVLWISNGDKATISVDQIRQIRQSLYVTPNDSDHKFYILENAHTMTTQAQNALLLSLEEPPPFVTFLLLTEDPASLLETIRSRAPVISMELFSPETVLDWLRKQKMPSSVLSDIDRCAGAAVLSGGALGQAKMLLTEDEEKSEPLRMRKLALLLLEGIFRKRTSELLGMLSGELPSGRDSMCLVFTMLQSALRDLIARKRHAEVAGQFLLGTEDVCRFAGKYSLSRLLALYSCCGTALKRLEANGSLAPCVTGFILQAKRI